MTPLVAELLAERRNTTPDRVAFIEGRSGRTVTWAGVQAEVGRWACRSGVVGICTPDPLEAATAFLAALAAGVTVASLNPAAPPSEHAAQLRAFRAAHTARPDAALVMTSSGTTGPPKAIPLSEGQLLHVAGQVAAHHRLGADDRGYCPLPLFHINALVVGVLSTLVAGGSLVLDARFSARSFWDVVDRHDVTWLNLVPAILGILADSPAAMSSPTDATGPAGVRFARSASSPLPAATRVRFERRFGIPILETYGMTEAASQITANPLDPARRRPGSVGQPVGVELRVVDGQIEIRGPSVESPAPGAWLRTGDMGHLDEDGFLFLTGRASDVINRGGEKVHPREVEEVLLEDPRLRMAVVVARPHPVLGEEPVAFVVTGEAADPAAGDERAALVASLAQRCERSLSPFKRPAEITVAETLPAGPTGKVRRAELRRLALEGASPP
jgi:acyl-CoA synthetase (AMP-forming)/AMP-acid ligase II